MHEVVKFAPEKIASLVRKRFNAYQEADVEDLVMDIYVHCLINYKPELGSISNYIYHTTKFMILRKTVAQRSRIKTENVPAEKACSGALLDPDLAEFVRNLKPRTIDYLTLDSAALAKKYDLPRRTAEHKKQAIIRRFRRRFF